MISAFAWLCTTGWGYINFEKVSYEIVIANEIPRHCEGRNDEAILRSFQPLAS